MTRLKCTRADQSIAGVFTVGKIYDVFGESPTTYALLGDDGYEWIIYRGTLGFPSEPHIVAFELVENPEDSFTTEEEDEEWQRIHQKQSEQSVDCPVAIAYHIHELQKWLKHIGCSSGAEFRISPQYVRVSPDESANYEAKEGGVGTLIEYMRYIGGASECVRKMENIG